MIVMDEEINRFIAVYATGKVVKWWISMEMIKIIRISENIES